MFLGVVGKGRLAGQDLLGESRKRTKAQKRKDEGSKQILQVHGIKSSGDPQFF